MSWTDYIGTAAGLALAPVTGGVSIGIGAGIDQARKSASANKEAVAQQQAGTDQQLALQKQQYADAQARLAPYYNGGLSEFNTLLGLSGLPTVGNGATAADPTSAEAGAADDGLNMQMVSRGGGTPEHLANVVGKAMPRPGTLADIGKNAVQEAAQAQTSSGYDAPTPGMIRMQAPDGTMADIEPQDEAHFTQKGAVRVA